MGRLGVQPRVTPWASWARRSSREAVLDLVRDDSAVAEERVVGALPEVPAE